MKFSSILLSSIVTVVVIDYYLADVGQACDGFAGIQCMDHLVCVHIQEPTPIDGSGICLWR